MSVVSGGARLRGGGDGKHVEHGEGCGVRYCLCGGLCLLRLCEGLLQSRLEQGACVKIKVKICFFMYLIIEVGWPLLLSPI